MKRGARALNKLIALPFTVVRGLFRLLWAGLMVVSGPVRRRIDTSPRFGGAINWLSSSMAPQRGVPMLVGTVLVALSLVTSGLVIILLVAAGRFGVGLYWLCIPAVLLHLGVLVGFIGIMLAAPLGQGYRDG
jgi:hypothetical protein